MTALANLCTDTIPLGSTCAAADPVATVQVLTELGDAEARWRALVREGGLGTPYQDFDWADAWMQHVGRAGGWQPFIVVGDDADGSPCFLWPLARRKQGPITIAEFIGGKHANFNVGLWQRAAAQAITPAGLHRILDGIAAAPVRVDALAFRNQPKIWGGIANPLALFAHQPSPSHGWKGRLAPDFEALQKGRVSAQTRKKIRKKERLLADHGPVRLWRAASTAEITAVIDAFYVQKAERMRELGIANIFATAGVRDFIACGALRVHADGGPVIELYALSVGDSILATFGGTAAGGRFCGMFNSITRGPLADYSPGELLLSHVARTCAERGLEVFDLGVGDAPYKHLVCDEEEPLFDSFLPLTPLGRIACYGAQLHGRVKRQVKGSKTLLAAAHHLRRLGRLGFAPHDTERPQATGQPAV